MTIRFHLFVLALCAILPVLLIAIVLSTQLAERDRETVRQSSIDRARAMIIAVDAQLREKAGRLTLFTSPFIGQCSHSRALLVSVHTQQGR